MNTELPELPSLVLGANKLMAMLEFDASHVKRHIKGSERYWQARNAYDQLIAARNWLDLPAHTKWREQKLSNGQNGESILRLLDGVLRELDALGEGYPSSLMGRPPGSTVHSEHALRYNFDAMNPNHPQGEQPDKPQPAPRRTEEDVIAELEGAGQSVIDEALEREGFRPRSQK